MNDTYKDKEVQFYLDRAIDSAVMMMKSIVHNPRLSPTDQVDAIRRIADFHGAIALDLESCIHGRAVSLSLKGAAHKK